MTEILLITAGIALLLLLIGDIFITVLMPRGAGKITQLINICSSRIFHALARNRGENRLLEYTGVAILVSMVLTWLSLLWLGHFFIFLSDDASIVNSTTREATTAMQKLYFVGYCLSTLGLGDYVPNGDNWRLYTSVLSFSGFIILTLGITYIVPVLNSIIDKNSLSLRISCLGKSPQDILNNAWNGEDFSALDAQFSGLVEAITHYDRNHLAYPILHYIHNSTRAANSVLQLVCLDEALTILLHHVPAQSGVNRLTLIQLRRALSSYINSLPHIEPAKTAPEPPGLERLHESTGRNLIQTSGQDHHAIYTALQPRRRQLEALVKSDGWKWKDVYADDFDDEFDKDLHL